MYINKFYPGRSFPLGTESTSNSHLRDTEDEFCKHQKWIELILGDEIRWERKQPKQPKTKRPETSASGPPGPPGLRLRTTKLLDSNEGDMDSVVGWHSEDMRMLPMWNVSLQDGNGGEWEGGAPGVYKHFCDGVYLICWVSLKANPTDSESNDLPLLLSSRSSTRSFLIFGVCLW